ncbi:hypothetical protein MO973_33275 [Paenibacillus sp. TRM 82003]|nr:hypothetical protein [Paenibacillus sp. TRM 82003]
MFQELNDRLAELKGKARQKANWEQRAKELKERLEKEERFRDRYEEQWKAEQKDVDQLTGLSLGALFYALIGKKAEKLDEQEAELLQAKLHYEEAADTVRDIEEELAALKGQLAGVRFIEGDIRTVMEQKTKQIRDAHPELAAQLEELTDREAEAKADAKELGEAVSAGRAVLSALNRAEERLGSAKNWGTYDMLGGGMISTAMKHNRIDEARSAIHSAQSALHRFQSELKDVERDISIHIEIGDMLTFADYFFDGLIADWMVQGRINDSLTQVGMKRNQVSRIVSELEVEHRKAESALQTLERQRSSLIENAK